MKLKHTCCSAISMGTIVSIDEGAGVHGATWSLNSEVLSRGAVTEREPFPRVLEERLRSEANALDVTSTTFDGRIIRRILVCLAIEAGAIWLKVDTSPECRVLYMSFGVHAPEDVVEQRHDCHAQTRP